MRTAAKAKLTVALFLGLLSILPAAHAEKYPDRPITIIIPWGAGGGGDRVARVMADALGSALGVSAPVINVPGASGRTGLQKLLIQPADGYGIVEITSDTYILLAGNNPGFKLSDFSTLAIVDQQPPAFFVQQDSPWKTWDDVLAAAKAGDVKVAGSGFGTQSDVTVRYLSKTLGLKFVSVPYAKPSERFVSLLGGHVGLLYAQAGDLSSYLNNKQMRPILIFADRRLPEFPQIPTANELRYHITMTHFRAFAVKQGIDPQRLKTLLDAMSVVSQTSKYKELLQSEAALTDSYVAGPQADQYIREWVEAVRTKVGDSSHRP